MEGREKGWWKEGRVRRGLKKKKDRRADKWKRRKKEGVNRREGK